MCGFWRSLGLLFTCSSPKRVQVYLAVDTPKDVDIALIKLCNDISYECKISKHITALQHDVPLIVVCPVISRLEPDIDHALNGLDWQSPFIALIIHHGNEDSRPGLPTDTRLSEKPTYKNAKFVDMAYSWEFYTCKMNEDAKQTIKETLDDASAHPSTDKEAQKPGICCRIFCCCKCCPQYCDDKEAQKPGIFCGIFCCCKWCPRWLLSLSSSPKNVQVYFAVDTPKDVDTALMKLCKDMSYKCEIRKHIDALQHDVPLIVVCQEASRLEPDIDHALNGLDWQSPFIVLVLHQGNEDSLPLISTEKKLPEKPNYENAKFVDIAYSLEFYACDMNDDAKQKITAFVDSFYK